MNSVNLKGRLGADPEIHWFDTKPGQRDPGCVARVNIAVDVYSGKKDEEGKAVRRTEWYTLKAYHKTGQFLVDHWKKGDEILVTGHLAQDKYTPDWAPKDKTITVNYIVAEKLTFCGGRRSQYDSPGDREAQERSAARPEPAGPNYDAGEVPAEFEDSIPF